MDRSLTDNQQYVRAGVFAAKKHRGQVRKYTGEPYVQHCLEVATMILQSGMTSATVVSAMLHDTVEDTDTTIEEIRHEFGHVVAEYVDNLTDRYTKESYPHLNRRARKQREFDRFAQCDLKTGTHTIKCADIISNARTIVQYDPAFAKVYVREMRELLAYLDNAQADMLCHTHMVLEQAERMLQA